MPPSSTPVTPFPGGQPPWWVFLLFGLASGGGGSVLGTKAFGSDGVTKTEVREIVDERIKANSVYLLQEFELLLARERLKAYEASKPE